MILSINISGRYSDKRFVCAGASSQSMKFRLMDSANKSAKQAKSNCQSEGATQWYRAHVKLAGVMWHVSRGLGRDRW
jgi:hypothetical protein